GLKRLSGQVLTENTTMIGMCRDLGFTVAMDPEDHSIVDVVLDLRKPGIDAVGADILIRPGAAGG
ncbi:MAG: hypothetical protein IOD08_32215, partial [Bradyrhizobium sp.]